MILIDKSAKTHDFSNHEKHKTSSTSYLLKTHDNYDDEYKMFKIYQDYYNYDDECSLNRLLWNPFYLLYSKSDDSLSDETFDFSYRDDNYYAGITDYDCFTDDYNSSTSSLDDYDSSSYDNYWTYDFYSSFGSSSYDED